MKKLLMLVAIMLVVASVQAGTVNWGSAIAMGDGSSDVPVGSLIYLVYSATGFDNSSTFDINKDVSGWVKTHEVGASESRNGVFGDVWSQEDLNGSWRMVLVVDDQWWYVETEFSGLNPQSPAQNFNYNKGWDPDNVFLGDPNTYGGTVVPEPTSMALLALGVAAVGLRRRFRK